MIDIYLLEQFHAFYTCGTVSAAAELLHISQPALSRTMKKLEEELGVPLFIRSKNQLTLNSTGLRAAEYAEELLKANKDFESKIKAYDRQLRTISIGFCAPVPQTVLTPILNTLFDGMTISADMTDDSTFTQRLKSYEYNLAVLHEDPKDKDIYIKKCGHEDLFISLIPGDPLTFYPKIHLADLNGKSILLLSHIGFWMNLCKDKTPNTKYLQLMDQNAYYELSQNSNFPSFSSSYYLRRGKGLEGKIAIPMADPECHTDYFLACLTSEKEKYKALFEKIQKKTIY